jgi:hypothetical protein
MKSVLSSRLACFVGIAYLAARIVEPAKLMMTSTRETLTQIALACGCR